MKHGHYFQEPKTPHIFLKLLKLYHYVDEEINKSNLKKLPIRVHCYNLAYTAKLYALNRGFKANINIGEDLSFGYNAYLILKTCRDEYGSFLPLSIRSFDDYKPPLYTYLTVPSVALFGLSVWSTRLPSAVMGILAVVGVYFLVLVLPVQLNKNYNNYKDYNLIVLKFSVTLLSSPPQSDF